MMQTASCHTLLFGDSAFTCHSPTVVYFSFSRSFIGIKLHHIVIVV